MSEKKVIPGLKQLRSPIPFHGGGAFVEGDLLVLPAGMWIANNKLYLYEPVTIFGLAFTQILDGITRTKITSEMFDEFVNQAIEKTVKRVVKSVHCIIFAHYCNRDEKYWLFSRWYEAYLTAFFLAMLDDLKLEIGYLSSIGSGTNLFFDEYELHENFISKDVVIYHVDKVCKEFKKTYKLIDETVETNDRER